MVIIEPKNGKVHQENRDKIDQELQEQKWIKCKICGCNNQINSILKHLSKSKSCSDEYSDNEKKILKKKSRQFWYKTNREYLLGKMRENNQDKKDEISKKKE